MRKKKQIRIIELFNLGKSPYDIAQELNVATTSVLRSLQEEIGKGELLLSDLFFSIPQNSEYQEEQELLSYIKENIDFRGDMYKYIVDIELSLHEYIRKILIDHFGEDDWFKKGIPKNIQKKCYQVMNDDEYEIEDPFCYTVFIDLGEIISKNSNIFNSRLPNYYSTNIKKLKLDIKRLNDIRNIVMHPIKRKNWELDDFYFVREFQQNWFA
ncbi:MAG TPA: hypothetical protein VLA32_06325 [Anaerolineales bacterium]|nr:hypothetical protein [Anaerolineales bacterium]